MYVNKRIQGNTSLQFVKMIEIVEDLLTTVYKEMDIVEKLIEEIIY